MQLNWRLMSFFILEFAYKNNITRIPAGDIEERIKQTFDILKKHLGECATLVVFCYSWNEHSKEALK